LVGPRAGVRSGCRAYRWQYGAGEVYERVGVDGNHVVLPIGVGVRQQAVQTVTMTKRFC
jgi:hypothetical protein